MNRPTCSILNPDTGSDIPIYLVSAAAIYGADGAFLGNLGPPTDRWSIANPSGTHGDPADPLCIWNRGGAYGDMLSPLSCYCPTTTTPPTIRMEGVRKPVPLSVNRALISIDPTDLKRYMHACQDAGWWPETLEERREPTR